MAHPWHLKSSKERAFRLCGEICSLVISFKSSPLIFHAVFETHKTQTKCAFRMGGVLTTKAKGLGLAKVNICIFTFTDIIY